MDREFEEYLERFSRLGKRVAGLERARALMKALGSPQDSLRFIHVTGTNGKGSICEMLSGAFTAAGYRTGLFTSPYITEYNDRIRINGTNISDGELHSLLPRIRAAAEESGYGRDFSQFEITMTAGLIYFKKCGCDIVILEAGLGGLLDCTNIIKDNVCSVIGSIGLDHTAILGDTVEQIAFQKAGIIKEGCPCILSPCNDESAVKVFKRQAKEKNALLLIPDMREIKITDTGFEYLAKNRYRGHYSPAMAGEHQVRNAAAVISACIVAGTAAGKGFELPPEAVKAGIESARLHGRAEIISRRPLIISDGGHNPDAAKALRQVLSGFYKKGERFTAVIGMSEDKNIKEYIRTVMPYIERFIPVDDFSDRAKNAKELSDIIKSCGGEVMPVMQTENAVSALFSSDSAGLICGSLYLVSAVEARSPRG